MYRGSLAGPGKTDFRGSRSVHSQADRDTAMKLSIPAIPISPAGGSLAMSSSTGGFPAKDSHSKPHKVLVVDDEPDAVQLAVAALSGISGKICKIKFN